MIRVHAGAAFLGLFARFHAAGASPVAHGGNEFSVPDGTDPVLLRAAQAAGATVDPPPPPQPEPESKPRKTSRTKSKPSGE